VMFSRMNRVLIGIGHRSASCHGTIFFSSSSFFPSPFLTYHLLSFQGTGGNLWISKGHSANTSLLDSQLLIQIPSFSRYPPSSLANLTLSLDDNLARSPLLSNVTMTSQPE